MSWGEIDLDEVARPTHMMGGGLNGRGCGCESGGFFSGAHLWMIQTLDMMGHSAWGTYQILKILRSRKKRGVLLMWNNV